MDVCYFYWLVIQGIKCQINPQRIPQHYAHIRYCCWSLFHVSSRKQRSLAPEIFHPNVKIMWQITRWYPIGTIYPRSNFSKAGLTSLISLAMASSQRVFTFFLFSAYAFATELGTSIPNLCVFLRYRVLLFLTRDIILNLFFSTAFTHQLNAGSWPIY